MRYVCPECGESGDAGACQADGALRVPVGADALLGTTIGSWRVARLLGTGGMGKVYVAVQPQIGARVAIKVLKRDSAADPDVVERFFNEARAVNLIKHEAIVDVIDLGRLPDGAPYIVMEYLEGASLGAILRRENRLPLGTVARIVSEVLAALEAAHAKGIIHRDLKPDNVFVSPSGRVTVLDFGIAKLATGDGMDATQTGSLLGTPAYMSPEQARTQPLDARADLYAVGVMLYEAATGTLPFRAANVFDLLHMHVATPPQPPRERQPDIGDAFEAVILRALEKEPAARFATAAQMRAALMAAAKDMPQLALSSIVFTARDAAAKQPSDPLAATAAAEQPQETQPSLARGETMPSRPPAARKDPLAAAPPAPATVQISKRMLYGLIGAAALVGLGGAAVMMAVARRDAADGSQSTTTLAQTQQPPTQPPPTQAQSAPQPQPQPQQQRQSQPQPPSQPQPQQQPQPQPQQQPQSQPQQQPQSPPQPQPQPHPQPQPQPQPARGQRPGQTPASGTTASTANTTANALDDMPAKRSTTSEPAVPERPTYKVITVPNASAFDPMAYWSTAEKLAKELVGDNVYRSTVTFRGLDRTGKLDLTGNGSAIYHFVSRDRVKAGRLDCLVMVQLEPGNMFAGVASMQTPEACRMPLIETECSLPQIWDKFVGKGGPKDGNGVFNRNFRRIWRVSVAGSQAYSEDVYDDCRNPVKE